MEKLDTQKPELIFTASDERDLTSPSPSVCVKLPIHILEKLYPVLNISLVSNRQEPQLSKTCLAYRHRGAAGQELKLSDSANSYVGEDNKALTGHSTLREPLTRRNLLKLCHRYGYYTRTKLWVFFCCSYQKKQ